MLSSARNASATTPSTARMNHPGEPASSLTYPVGTLDVRPTLSILAYPRKTHRVPIFPWQEEEPTGQQNAGRIPAELAAQIQRNLFGDSETPMQRRNHATDRTVSKKEKKENERPRISTLVTRRDRQDKLGTNGLAETTPRGTANFIKEMGTRPWNAGICKTISLESTKGLKSNHPTTKKFEPATSMEGKTATERRREENRLAPTAMQGKKPEWRSSPRSEKAARMDAIHDKENNPRKEKAASDPMKHIPVTFNVLDTEGLDAPHNDPLVITLTVGDCKVSRILIDTGRSVDMIFRDTVRKMNINENNVKPEMSPLVSFAGDTTISEGHAVNLPPVHQDHVTKGSVHDQRKPKYTKSMFCSGMENPRTKRTTERQRKNPKSKAPLTKEGVPKGTKV
ncbi:hypothetical protein Bca101_020853 [Brassica carinata]